MHLGGTTCPDGFMEVKRGGGGGWRGATYLRSAPRYRRRHQQPCSASMRSLVGALHSCDRVNNLLVSSCLDVGAGSDSLQTYSYSSSASTFGCAIGEAEASVRSSLRARLEGQGKPSFGRLRERTLEVAEARSVDVWGKAAEAENSR